MWNPVNYPEAVQHSPSPIAIPFPQSLCLEKTFGKKNIRQAGLEAVIKQIFFSKAPAANL